MAKKRYIITGSRDFPDKALVERVITGLVMEAHRSDECVVIVHGECATGADRYAADTVKKLIGQGYPVEEEPHPADWDGPLGKGAGPARNSAMVALGAMRTLAFWDGKSPGTLDAITKSVKKKIFVQIHSS